MLARVHRTRRERLKKEKSLKIVAKQINKIIFRRGFWRWILMPKKFSFPPQSTGGRCNFRVKRGGGGTHPVYATAVAKLYHKKKIRLNIIYTT
jgi:hypothetical protein